MSNKDNLWRLQDEEGKPVAEKPEYGVKFMMKKSNGKYEEVAKLQTLTWTNNSMPIREIGSANPVHETFMPSNDEESALSFAVERMEQLMRDERQRRAATYEIPLYEGNAFDGSFNARTETIRHEVPDIMDRIVREVSRYRRQFYHDPQYISLDKKHYRSFYIEARNSGFYPGSRTFAEQRFMGLHVICNAMQTVPVMAIGSPIEEAIEGRLYHE
jgi:hypothetical protein